MPAADATRTAPTALPEVGSTDSGADAPPAIDLPPLDSLTKDSDFAPFLQHGVPEDLKLAALRKLWASDPVWAAPERLDLHNLDYTWPSVPDIVRTAYRVGRGFIETAEPIAAAAPLDDAKGDAGGEAASAVESPAAERASPISDRDGTQNGDRLVDRQPPVGCNEVDEGSS